jgi:hypothetical protein
MRCLVHERRRLPIRVRMCAHERGTALSRERHRIRELQGDVHGGHQLRVRLLRKSSSADGRRRLRLPRRVYVTPAWPNDD